MRRDGRVKGKWVHKHEVRRERVERGNRYTNEWVTHKWNDSDANKKMLGPSWYNERRLSKDWLEKHRNKKIAWLRQATRCNKQANMSQRTKKQALHQIHQTINFIFTIFIFIFIFIVITIKMVSYTWANILSSAPETSTVMPYDIKASLMMDSGISAHADGTHMTTFCLVGRLWLRPQLFHSCFKGMIDWHIHRLD